MDIVERLRRTELHHVWDDLEGKMVGKMFSANPDGPKAADEIERLRDQAHYHYENGLKKDVEIESLRDALRWAAPYVQDDPRVSAIIKAALKEGE